MSKKLKKLSLVIAKSFALNFGSVFLVILCLFAILTFSVNVGFKIEFKENCGLLIKNFYRSIIERAQEYRGMCSGAMVNNIFDEVGFRNNLSLKFKMDVIQGFILVDSDNDQEIINLCGVKGQNSNINNIDYQQVKEKIKGNNMYSYSQRYGNTLLFIQASELGMKGKNYIFFIIRRIEETLIRSLEDQHNVSVKLVDPQTDTISLNNNLATYYSFLEFKDVNNECISMLQISKPNPMNKIFGKMVWLYVLMIVVMVISAILIAHTFKKRITGPNKKLMGFLGKTTDEIKQIASPIIDTVREYTAFKNLIFESNLQKEKLCAQNDEIKVMSEELYQSNEELQSTNEELERQGVKLIQANDSLSQKQKELERALKNLMESIQYAQKIQNALMPQEADFRRYFQDSFLLYMPCNIVGGDFYYLREVGSRVIIAAADCTGHGVPGALLSVLSISSLNSIINQDKDIKANQILEELRRIVIDTMIFNSRLKDGLDISLIILDRDTLKLEYAGANTPLYIIREDDLIEYKPTKCPIGHFPVMREFESTTIPILEGDMIYLFSDGFQDQIGGPQNKKYSRNSLKMKFLEINTIACDSQKQVLKNTLEEWLHEGDAKQIDDITIIGLKV